MNPNEPGGKDCQCWRCHDERGTTVWWMVFCQKCGYKRCPHANDHRHECTRSNADGQPGSNYGPDSGGHEFRCRMRLWGAAF